MSSSGALLGVALGLVLGIDFTIGIIASSVALVAMLLLLQRQRRLALPVFLRCVGRAGHDDRGGADDRIDLPGGGHSRVESLDRTGLLDV